MKTKHGNHREAGFTIVELMTSVAITVILTGAALGLAKRAEAGTAQAVAELSAVDGWRVALERLAADLRAATSVRTTVETTSLNLAGRHVAWTLKDGQLTRTGPGEPSFVTRQVRHLEVASTGRRHTIELVVEKPGTSRVLELRRVVAGRTGGRP